ncbi:1,4-alpha-glucan branching protein GlgB [Salinarimonas sp. NSM]|uniref:1,4-alpha-glucan branching protein GlgB n=1 Tax=Salinarimonas sp. NSM TaxID=3458003 RepID=UPI0040355372
MTQATHAPEIEGVEAAAMEALAGRLTDPFAFLGMHDTGQGPAVRAFLPGAEAVEVVSRENGEVLGRLNQVREGLHAGLVSRRERYRLRISWPGTVQETEDPYSFGMVLGDLDLHLFSEGAHWDLAERFGAQPMTHEGVEGVAFSVWAPNARRVSVIGDFNSWDGRRHPMRLRHSAGVWELFVPRIGPGERYKYEIVGKHGETLPPKADPLARRTETPPANASIVAAPHAFRWTDEEWMAKRGARQAPTQPMAVYEVHPASWLRPEGEPQGTLDWDQLIDTLIPYVADLGFTHIELMPIMEHPFGGSWGYQPLSLFAPSARYGTPEGFARFVDACHRADLGVILDWVPAHFPTDPHGLARFDGTALYEHEDPREGYHQDWNTYIYNMGRKEVQGFLVASALWWTETFHIDALRVDAVASMLYRDYSREHDQWIPNRFGGRENLESIDFLKRMNQIVQERAPGAITIAEESTAFPGVSQPVSQGGLGFSYKWNMGWMHDTLHYIQREPLYRSYHHNELTFGLVYAFSEKFVLPISHDEVVHGKGSLIGKMPGDEWQKLANLRAYFGFMWTHPGKKLLFMGCEIGQHREWNHDGEIEWALLKNQSHAGLQMLVRDLNKLYAREPALFTTDAEPSGFEWIVGDDTQNSVFAYLRRGTGDAKPLLVVLNMTPVPRHEYRIGVPEGGTWSEILNTDAQIYGGTNLGNAGAVRTEAIPAHGRSHSVGITLPPLAAVVFRHQA